MDKQSQGSPESHNKKPSFFDPKNGKMDDFLLNESNNVDYQKVMKLYPLRENSGGVTSPLTGQGKSNNNDISINSIS